MFVWKRTGLCHSFGIKFVELQDEWYKDVLSNIGVDIGQRDQLVHAKSVRTHEFVMDIFYFYLSILS